MEQLEAHIGQSVTQLVFDGQLEQLSALANGKQVIILTDENVYAAHHHRLMTYPVITMPAGEQHKNLQTLERVLEQLVDLKADRSSWLVGVGGGVVTDMAGLAASLYMRGIPFGFVPTSILAMVDAAIGGKNGVDMGVYKNMIGTIRQPAFLLYDVSLLESLPEAEWVNGFAEILKHAAIRDREMFEMLEAQRLEAYREDRSLLNALIRRNALLKLDVVQHDEKEQGERKTLNFGHTLGHAIENLYNLPHGSAIAIGMVFAGELSEKFAHFGEQKRLKNLISRYGLPTHGDVDPEAALNVLRMDKKKSGEHISYILLRAIGDAVIHPLKPEEIREGWS